MFEIGIKFFVIINKEKKSQFLKKIFLLANFSINVVLKMLFFILSNVKINFIKLGFFRRTYTFIKAISTND